MKPIETKKSLSGHYCLLYSISFLVMAFLAFDTFLINEKSFIWKTDGFPQHYRALLYYARYLKDILRQLVTEGAFCLPTYSFALGYGSDLIGTLHYYVIGDPITALSCFVPEDKLPYFYSASIVLRLYLSGLAFSLYCFYRKTQMNESYSNGAVLIGSLVYVFCGYALFTSIRHPYFTNPMIYFPLVLLGVENILDGRKPCLLVLAVFLSAISNFYFFYMIVLLTVLYVLWRVLTIYGRSVFRQGMATIGKITFWSALGTAMSAVILLPVILTFLGDLRSDTARSVDLLYPAKEYIQILRNFLTVNDAAHYRDHGYAAIALICLIALFLQKQHRDIKIAILAMFAMQMVPWVGSVLNGFSYVSNRWIWGFSLMVAFVTVLMWDRLLALSVRDVGKIALGLGLYFTLCLSSPHSRGTPVFASLVFAFAAIALLLYSGLEPGRQRLTGSLLLLCVLANLSMNAFLFYSPRSSNYVGQFYSYQEVEDKLSATEFSALDQADTGELSFYRYAGSATTNAALGSSKRSTQYYWSLSNGHVSEFLRETGLVYNLFQNYSGLDNRTILSSLANVAYYVQGSNLPLGYTKCGTYPLYDSVDAYLAERFGDAYREEALTQEELSSVKAKIPRYTVWKNQYALPFGYTYTGYLPETVYDAMSPLQKQEAMLQAVVIRPEDAPGIPADPEFTGVSIPYELSLSQGVSLEDGLFRVTKEKATATLSFTGLGESETYLFITGLGFESTEPREKYTDLQWQLLSRYDQRAVEYSQKNWTEPTSVSLSVSVRNSDSKTLTKTLRHYTPAYTWYNGQEDYMLNLNYDPLQKTAITIQFPTAGTYSFDSIEVLCQPLDRYPRQIAALAEDVLEQVDFHDSNIFNATNRVTGRISLDQPKYLLLSIPYSTGWSACVNGEEQPLLRANTMFMALSLPAGDHAIELRYKTPGLIPGIWISLTCAAVFVLYMAADRRKDRHPR